MQGGGRAVARAQLSPKPLHQRLALSSGHHPFHGPDVPADAQGAAHQRGPEQQRQQQQPPARGGGCQLLHDIGHWVEPASS